MPQNHGIPAVAGNTPQKRPVLWTRDFILICTYNLLIFFSFQMISTTMPVYIKSIGGNSFIIGLITGIFTASAIAVRPWTGKWLDKYGRKGLWLLGTFSYLAVIIGYNWALSIPSLTVLRFLHGGTFGIIVTAAAAGATDLVPMVRMGEGMGFFGMGINLGMAFGPILGFFLLDRFNFSVLFFTSAALAVLSIITVKILHLPKIGAQTGAPPAALWEPTAAKPTILMALATIILGGIFNFVVIYGTEMGIHNASLYFSVYALSLVMVRPFAGMVFDRFGHRLVVITGFVGMGAGAFTLSLSTGLAGFLLAAVIIGFGFALIQPALQALAVSRCAPTRRATAQATFTASYDIGIGTGSIFLGYLAQFTGYGGMFLVSAFVALFGIIIYFLLLGKDKKPYPAENRA